MTRKIQNNLIVSYSGRLKKQYGTQASGIAWQACRNEIGFRTSSWYVAPSVPVIRENDGKYNCYQRVWGEKSK
jgi:hypothetical protein